jgi:hypothetical protein
MIDHLMFVLVSTESVKAYPVVDNRTSCEIRFLIPFVRDKVLTVDEIHRELYSEAYGQMVMGPQSPPSWPLLGSGLKRWMSSFRLRVRSVTS